MEAMTHAPPKIWSGSNISPTKIYAKTAADIGSRVAVMLARVDLMWLMPTKYRPNGRIVPKMTM